MSGRAFIDTNILVYAHQANAGRRHEIAAELVRRSWRDRTGVLSTQVLQELYVNLRKKAMPPLSQSETSRLIDDYLAWKVVVNDGRAIQEAIELERRHQLSFWDALIVHAATAAGVEEIYSEDFAHGRRYGSIKAVNPFLATEDQVD
jgi:predicted nucleic acid-binding protein